MANALRANSTAAGDDVWVALLTAAYSPDVYVELEVSWPAASKTAWDTDGYIPWFIAVDQHDAVTAYTGSPRQSLFNFFNAVNLDYSSFPTAHWYANDSTDISSSAADDTWHVIRIHADSSFQLEFGVDGGANTFTGDEIAPNVPNTDTGVSSPFGDVAAHSKIAGRFQADSDGDLALLKIPLQKNGSPSDSVRVQVCADGGGAPGTILDTQTIAASSLPANATFTYSPGITLSHTGYFWIVLSRTGALDPTNNYSYAAGGGTANGEYFDSGSSTWGTFGSRDVNIRGAWQMLPFLLAIGSYFADPVDAPVYYRSVKIGTSGFGSSDLFSEDWSTGNTAITADWTSHNGTITSELDVVTDPFLTSDFSVNLSPSTLTIPPGNTDSTALTTSAFGGDTESITLSATGAPSGTTVSFVTNPITAGGGSTVNVAVGVTAPGTYTITIHATGTSNTHTTALTLIVAVSLVTSPTSGCHGTVVTLTGAGFDASSPITVTFDGQDVPFSEVNSDSSGNISGTLSIPEGFASCLSCTFDIVVTTGGGATQSIVWAMCCPEASDVPDDSLTTKLGDYVTTTGGRPLDYIRFDGAHWFVIPDDSAGDPTNQATLPPPTNHALSIVRVDDVGAVTTYEADTGYAWQFASSFGTTFGGGDWPTKLYFTGWKKPIYDAKLATDGVNLWLAVLCSESVIYPYISSDDGHAGHPDQASQFVDLATLTSGFTSFPTSAGAGYNRVYHSSAGLIGFYNKNPPYSDSGTEWFGYWNPPRLAVYLFDGATFNRLDTEDAKYCPGTTSNIIAATNQSIAGPFTAPIRYNAGGKSSLLSGVSACASPSEPGVCHVVWAEGGAYGRYGAKNTGDPLGEDLDVWDGNAPSVGYRVSYTRWSTSAKTLSSDLFSSSVDRHAWYFTYDAGSGAHPYGYTWPDTADLAWTNAFQLRNDGGFPVLFLSALSTAVAVSLAPNGDPDPHGNPWLDNAPSYADVAVGAYDLSSGAAVLSQSLDPTLLPTVAEVGSVPTNVNSTFELGFNGINNVATFPGGGFAVSQPYADPLLAGEVVYLLGIPLANQTTGFSPVDGSIGWYRIPVDLSDTFDFVDGIRAVGYSIMSVATVVVDVSEFPDFFSDTRNVWYPTFNVSTSLAQLDRICADQWVTNPTFYPSHAVDIPPRASPGLYYNPFTGALYYVGWYGVSGGSTDYAIVQAHICRRCLPCACVEGTGLHVWQTS